MLTPASSVVGDRQRRLFDRHDPLPVERSAGQEGDLAITIEDAERVRIVIALDVEDDVSHAWRQCDPVLSSRLVDGREHLLNVFGVIVAAGLVVLLDDLGHRRRRGNGGRFEHQSVLEPGGVRAGELGRRLGCCRFVRWQHRHRRDRHGVAAVVGTAAGDGAGDDQEQYEHDGCTHGGSPLRALPCTPGILGARS